MLEVGGEAALIADAGGQATLPDHRLQGLVDLGPPAQRLGEGRGADRGDHELLDVHVVIGVRAAVQDVHHRDGQHVGVRAAEVAEQRQAAGVRSGAGDGHADAHDRVRAQARLVRRPVQVDHGLVDEPLVVDLMAEQFRLDLVDNVLDRAGHALAAVFGAAVSQLDGLEGAGGGPARYARPGHGPVIERHLDLEGRVAPGIQDLPGMYRFNGGHRRLLAYVRVTRLYPAGRMLAHREPSGATGAPAHGPRRQPGAAAPRAPVGYHSPAAARGGSVEVSPVPRIAGALLFRPSPHVDERGFFCRTFDAEVVRAAGIDPAGSFRTACPVRCAA